MINLITGLATAGRRQLLDAMFADRKWLFVDLLGWELALTDKCLEIDGFDGERAVYIVESDTTGAHRGSLRLLPTDRPHILGSLFPALCPDGVPAGPNVYEITRLCLPPRYPAPERLAIRNRLISAMVDHAVAAKIGTLTGVVSESFRRQVLAMGWAAEALGPALIIDGARLGAFRILIVPDTPARLAATRIYVAGTLDPLAERIAA